MVMEEERAGCEGEKREVRKKNSFFKYYNIKFFENQVRDERVRMRFLICELKGE